MDVGQGQEQQHQQEPSQRYEKWKSRRQEQIEWRRNKVNELSVKGYSQRRIAGIMNISLALVNEGLQVLRNKARGNKV
jgi:hypothetical protein